MTLIIFAACCGVGCAIWLIKCSDWDVFAAIMASLGVLLFPPAFLIAFIVAKVNDAKRSA